MSDLMRKAMGIPDTPRNFDGEPLYAPEILSDEPSRLGWKWYVNGWDDEGYRSHGPFQTRDEAFRFGIDEGGFEPECIKGDTWVLRLTVFEAMTEEGQIADELHINRELKPWLDRIHKSSLHQVGSSTEGVQLTDDQKSNLLSHIWYAVEDWQFQSGITLLKPDFTDWRNVENVSSPATAPERPAFEDEE